MIKKKDVKNMQFIDLKAQYRALKAEIDANIQAVLDCCGSSSAVPM